MGWMWSSSSPPAATPSKGAGPDRGEARTQPQTQAPAAPAARGAQTASTTTTTDYGDPEIAKFMAQLHEEFGGKPSAAEPTKSSTTASTSPEPAPTNKPSSWSFWRTSSSQQHQQPPPPSEPTTSRPSTTTPDRSSTTTSTPQRLDPLSESLLPTTMSCRAAFDAAFHCNSLGGQWTSVYRSGGVRSCSEHWDDFWFCMRTRTYPGPLKEEAIRDHYRRRELARYHGPGKPSSTDVWEPRTERLPPGAAFREPLGPMPHDLSDEEWYAMEIERRRRVQEALRDT
ncbi:hypothetical protein DL771_006971 [Monosporascus sp. 5C6A]|nr:hypothetical protein DL771_006971 [Monosporascus sp. 5C6A]